MKKMRARFVYFLLFAMASGATAQDGFADFRKQMEAQRLEIDRQQTESRLKLKEAIIRLREARQRSCQFQSRASCILVELSSVELVMLNVEETYRLAENRSRGENRAENYKRIQELADELRSKTNELAEAVEKAEK